MYVLMRLAPRLVGLFLGLLTLFAALAAFASPPTTQANLVSLAQEAAQLAASQRWDKSLAVLDQIHAILPDNPEIDYNRACCQARLGEKKEAIATLGRSVHEGFAQADHIAADPDLASLHADPQFNDIVAQSRKIPLSSLSPVEKAIKAQQDNGLMNQQMQNKDWTAALATSDELQKLAPIDGIATYNRACVLARLGKAKDALKTLDASIDAGFVDSAHMQVDDDLQSLHHDPEFPTLVAKAEKVGKDYTRFPAEKGADLPEVKTIDELVPGAMRYRLRMSKHATPEHPDRLVVWFHPSGGSMDNVVEALAPLLVRHHLALLVFPQKDFLGWTNLDVDYFEKTLDAVAQIPGIDAHKPLGIGFSAGGQLLIDLYNQSPAQFGGLVLDSAYPIIMTDQAHGHIFTPARSPTVKHTPILAVVGGADPNGKIWDTVAPAWKDAGVPLTLVTVPDAKHEWLFNTPDQQKILIDWLAVVAAGKLPGAPNTQPTTR